jgi:nucleoside-triphosphatase THEP1
MDECVSVLLDLTRDNPAIICIDALDECDLATRRQLLDAIGTVINCSEQIVKVFVSSRREDDFLDYFEKWEALEISAKENREDIVNFIDAELTRITDNKTLLHGKASKELISEIRQVLLDGADGM